MRTILFLIGLFTSALLVAQDYKKDMQALNSHYNQDGFITIGIKIRVFQEASSSPVFTQEALVRKKDKNFFSTMGTTKMLLTSDAFLLINEADKAIILQEIDKKEYTKYVNQMLSIAVDSMESKYDSVVYAGKVTNRKHYVVYTSKKEIQKTDVYMEDNTLSKLIYHYDAKKSTAYSKIEITFSNSTAMITEDCFSASKYVTKSGKEYKLKPAYSKYQLLINKNNVQ